MPEFVILGVRTMRYTGNFTANGVIAGFDTRVSAYGETTEANATIRVVPWAPAYTVVVQTLGTTPRKRTYRALLYREIDYLALQGLVGAQGILTTPREAPPAGGVLNAVLLSVKRGDMQNPADATGEQTVDLEFVMIA